MTDLDTPENNFKYIEMFSNFISNPETLQIYTTTTENILSKRINKKPSRYTNYIEATSSDQSLSESDEILSLQYESNKKKYKNKNIISKRERNRESAQRYRTKKNKELNKLYLTHNDLKNKYNNLLITLNDLQHKIDINDISNKLIYMELEQIIKENKV